MSHPVNSTPPDRLSQVGHLPAPRIRRDTDANTLLKPVFGRPLPCSKTQALFKALFKKAPESAYARRNLKGNYA
jgi:hypothetical protein